MEFPVLHNRFPSATCLRGLSDPHLSSALRVEEGDGEKVPCQLLREASDKQPHLKSVDESREKEKKKESFFFSSSHVKVSVAQLCPTLCDPRFC